MNEVTALIRLARDINPVIALCQNEGFVLDSEGNSAQLWEVTRPVANVYNFDDSAYVQAWGDYSGTETINYTINTDGSNYTWSGDDGSSGSGLLTTNAIRVGNGIFFRFNRIDYFQGGEFWTFSIVPFVALTDGNYNPWSWWGHLTSFFFVNYCNKLKFMTGSTVNNLGWATQDAPSGRHVVVWMGKVFISDPNFQGSQLTNGLMWSDTYDFFNFTTKFFVNEADQFQFDDPLNVPEEVNGCTGLAPMGVDQLIYYTPGSIWGIKYVGMDAQQKNVMLRYPISTVVGSVFPYGVVSKTDAHAFIGVDNFYMLPSGGAPKQIGDRVWAGFQQDLSTDINLRYMVRGYHDPIKREVWWCYCSSKSTGNIDRKVGYNYVSDTWQFADATEHCFLHTRLPVGTNPIASLTNTIDSYTDPISSMGGATSLIEKRLYGCPDRQIQQETTTPTIPENEPFIETADIIYDPAKMVDINGMDIHADYNGMTCQGVQVEWSSRNNISDPVVWNVAPKLWTKGLATTRYGYPRTRGRIFRFRFTFKKSVDSIAVVGAKFYFWNEFVRMLALQADDK